MAWKATFTPEQMTIAVAASGIIRNGEARAQLAEAICLLKQHDTSRVLLDFSQAVWEASLPELYWLPDDAAALGVPWDARVAMVPPQGDCRNELCRFLELVCHNAGYNLRLFGAKTVAEQWLTAPPRASAAANQASLTVQA